MTDHQLVQEKEDAQATEGETFEDNQAQQNAESQKAKKPNTDGSQTPKKDYAEVRQSREEADKAKMDAEDRRSLTPSEELKECESIKPERLHVAMLIRDDKWKYKYGWLGFNPRCLQKLFRKPVTFLVVLCMVSMAQSCGVYGVMTSASSHIREHYGFTLTDTQWLFNFYMLGRVISVFPIAYFSMHSAHKARWIGIGALLTAMGFTILIIPEFTPNHMHKGDRVQRNCAYSAIPEYTPNLTTLSTLSEQNWTTLSEQGEDDLNITSVATTLPSSFTKQPPVKNTTPKPKCTNTQKRNNNYKYVFMSGALLCGIGAAPVTAMGPVMLDEHVEARLSTVYIGIYLVADIGIGTLFGELLTGFFLQNEKDHGDLKHFLHSQGLEPDTSFSWQWAMVISASLTAFSAFLMLGFPYELGGSNQARQRRTAESWRMDYKGDWAWNPGEGIWQMVKRSSRLMRTIPFVCLVLERSFSLTIVLGLGSVLPTYIQSVFMVSSSSAAYYAGGAALGGLILAMGLGTLVQYKFHFDVKGNLRLGLFSAVFTLLCSFCFMTTCPYLEMTGHDVPYSGQPAGNIIMDSDCNAMCGCSTAYSNPMCADDVDPVTNRSVLKKFFSPCYAGCSQATATDGFNCGCLVSKGSISVKICDDMCDWQKYAFLIAFYWLAFSIFFRHSAMYISTFRVVPFDYRIVALCVMIAVSSLLGVPGVQAVGSILNACCKQWRDECEKLQCATYDTKYLALVLTGFTASGSLLIIIVTVIAYFTYKPPEFKSSILSDSTQWSASRSKTTSGTASGRISTLSN